MKDKTETENFLEYLPALQIWYKALLTYIFQIIIFISSIIFFWWISSQIYYGALIGQFIIAFSGTLTYIFMANNAEKIREKYIGKYDDLAGQAFWYHCHLYIIPLQSASLYLPLLLKTDYFLPSLINLPSHFITDSLFLVYAAIPLGIIFITLGILIINPSVIYAKNVVGNRLHLICPEKSKLITNGIYRYIRNPQYLGRGVIAVGFGVIANNLLAICVGLIHFLSFWIIIPAEDKELERRFGDEFESYRKKVPALIPKYGNWKRFLRLTFFRKEN